jgi:hypothetical protein
MKGLNECPSFRDGPKDRTRNDGHSLRPFIIAERQQ